jgi:hypothetical protein
LDQRAYAQIYRTSEVEVVVVAQVREVSEPGRPPSRLMDYRRLEDYIATSAFNYAQFLNRYGTSGPYALLASLIGAQGVSMQFPNYSDSEPGPAIKSNTLPFIEAVMDTAPESVAETCMVLRGVLDHLANAGGEPRSPNFDRDGRYTGPLLTR